MNYICKSNFNYLFFLCVALNFIGCSRSHDFQKKATVNSTDRAISLKEEALLDSVGYYHNILLKKMFKSGTGFSERKRVGKLSYKVVLNSMLEEFKKLRPDIDFNFDKNPRALECSKIAESYFDLIDSKNGKGDVDITNYVVDRMISLGYIKKVSADSFLKMLQSVQSNGFDKDSIKDDVTLRNYLSVYNDTYLHSKAYWFKEENEGILLEGRSSNTSPRFFKDSSRVIAADAVGATLGLYGGPIWSIVQGAVVSIVANESLRVVPLNDREILPNHRRDMPN